MPLTRAAPGSPARLPHAAAVPGPRGSRRSGAAPAAVPRRWDPLPRAAHGAAGPGRATRPHGTQRALLAARRGEAVQGRPRTPAGRLCSLPAAGEPRSAGTASNSGSRAGSADRHRAAKRVIPAMARRQGIAAPRAPPRAERAGRARRRLPGASAAGGGPDTLPRRSRAGRGASAALQAGAGPEPAAPRPARLALAPPPAATREPRRRPAGGGERSGAARHLRAPRRPRLRGSALAPPSSPGARAAGVGPGPAPRQGEGRGERGGARRVRVPALGGPWDRHGLWGSAWVSVTGVPASEGGSLTAPANEIPDFHSQK